MVAPLSLDDSCITRYQTLGRAVCEALTKEAVKQGLTQAQLPSIEWADLAFKVVVDPADGSECLSGDWLNPAGYRIGTFQLNGNGSFFAEHDVVQPHPTDKRWFIEAVTAWGTESKIITEPRLIATP